MPKGVYKRTEYHNKINSECHKRENLSEKALEALRYKRTAWHREINRRGHLGQVVSLEARKKMSITRKGVPKSKQHRENISNALRGRKISMETRIKHSKTLTGVSYEEKFGVAKANDIKRKQSLVKKGISTITEEGRKKLSENKKGVKNPMWKNGSSFGDYGLNFNLKFKEIIRDRDNHICMMCGLPELNDEKLSIHHIDYIKKNTCKENCISLHRICHAKTNQNKEYWKAFFNSKLKINGDDGK